MYLLFLHMTFYIEVLMFSVHFLDPSFAHAYVLPPLRDPGLYELEKVLSPTKLQNTGLLAKLFCNKEHKQAIFLLLFISENLATFYYFHSSIAKDWKVLYFYLDKLWHFHKKCCKKAIQGHSKVLLFPEPFYLGRKDVPFTHDLLVEL